MTAADRETILERFAAWLDQALSPEDPPRGVPLDTILAAAEAPPEGGDLYSVQAALTALTQEVKLEGRGFRQLSETLAPVAALAPALESLMEDARIGVRREMLDGLLDLADRLARGRETARQAAAALPRRRWWQLPESRHGAGIVAALGDGYELTAARLDEMLASFGVREIECAGRPFDARRMHAVGIEETGAVAEGTVVEVCRRGYEWRNQVYRAAQVRVARPPRRQEDSEP